MADWSLLNREWSSSQYDPYQYAPYPYYQDYQDNKMQTELPAPQPCLTPQAQPYNQPSSPSLTLLLSSSQHLSSPTAVPYPNHELVSKPENPREIRNKAEKQRRDKLNHSISELAAMVPPVVASSRKIDKTGVLRLTAHYLRAYQHVFGDSLDQTKHEFNPRSAETLLGILDGFLLTITYRGLIVVVSQNVQQYLGYSELDLLGQNIFNVTHEDDRQMLREVLMPKSQMLGPNGELLVPDEPDGKQKVAAALANEKRRFVVRFKKLSQRSEPAQYITCHVEGSFRKSDRACRGYTRCCQMVRRARARGDNPCNSGNDVVFIGVVRPTCETFHNESGMEAFRMEYRTRHSIDGQIIQSEQRISLVTGYMTHEVNGVNAMNFMHRDDVRWVIIALREMYDQHRLFGESCYRLMTKNGQFIYMRTRGRLDVDRCSRAVTSFVCTNTVVEEQEGKNLIRMMKKKFMLLVNDGVDTPEEEDIKDSNDSQTIPVEDPRQLEKVILHLVTNLPSPQPEDEASGASPDRGGSPSLRLSIIPPKKERIVSAIEKIYSIIKTFKREPEHIKTNAENQNKISIIEITSPTASESDNLVHQSPKNQNESTVNANHSQVIQMETPLPKLAPFNDIYIRRRSEITETLDGNKVISDIAQSSATFIDMKYMSKPNQSVPYAKIKSHELTHENVNSNGNDAVVDTTQPGSKIKYHVLITPRMNIQQSSDFQEDSSTSHLQLSQTAITSPVSGMKRSIDIDGEDIATKKKVSEINQQEDAEGRDSLTLENFFDEAILSTQIDSTIDTLEQTIDPTFPDLLISKDVQDILKEIEDNPGENDHST